LPNPRGGSLAAPDEFRLMTEFGQHRIEHDAAERIVLDAENTQPLCVIRRNIGIRP